MALAWRRAKTPLREQADLAKIHLEPGQILVDFQGRQWRLGRKLGEGGFATVYLGSQDLTEPVKREAPFAIKVEDIKSKIILNELVTLYKLSKQDKKEQWMKEKKLASLGVPSLIAQGTVKVGDDRHCRFLVLERYPSVFSRILRDYERLSIKTIFTVAIKIIDILEYVHAFGIVHGDVKSSNMLLRPSEDGRMDVFLIDYGLANHYVTEESQETFVRGLPSFFGTATWSGVDSFRGVSSRRSDLESLGYNLVHWAGGHLPWCSLSSRDSDAIYQRKVQFLGNLRAGLQSCFPGSRVQRGLKEYFEVIARTTPRGKPDYNLCRSVLSRAITKSGYKNDGRLLLKAGKRDLPREQFNEERLKESLIALVQDDFNHTRPHFYLERLFYADDLDNSSDKDGEERSEQPNSKSCSSDTNTEDGFVTP